MTTRSRIACLLTTLIAVLAIAACGSDDDSTEIGRAGTVSKASAGNHANEILRTGYAVGLDTGSDGHLAYWNPEYFTARCVGTGDQLSVMVSAEGGWRLTLEHGSQTITAENPDLKLPPAQFTTAAGAISRSQSLNPNGIPLGVTWDRPSPGDVEIRVAEDAPAAWAALATPKNEFVAYLHVSCGSAE